MIFLRFGPAAEVGNADQFHGSENACIFLGDLRIGRTVEMFTSEVLSRRRVKKFEVSLRDFARALLVHHLVDHRDGRFGKNAQRWGDDFVFARILLENEMSLVLPREEDIPDLALRERGRRSPRARVEHWDILVELSEKLPRLGFIAAIRAQCISVGREIVPPRAAGGLGIRRDDRDTLLHQIAPILDGLRVILAHDKDNRRGVG